MTGDKVSNLQNVQLESKNRQFTNFEKLLGEGGFGRVYLGYVDGNPVAVKMISQSAVEGYQQFHSEACNRNLCHIFFSSFVYVKIICDSILQVEPLIRVIIET